MANVQDGLTKERVKMNQRMHQILETASSRAKQNKALYYGDILPAEAWELLQASEDCVLVDVRTSAEHDFVGRVPGALEIPLKQYPGMTANENFVAQVQSSVRPDQCVMFLCRSGVRSVAAAQLLTDKGYAKAMNILEGFEGDKNELGHRRVNGWKMAGMPWSQG
jgi:rhodanese-related sulfurtransferase